jgi:hypothetical protein
VSQVDELAQFLEILAHELRGTRGADGMLPTEHEFDLSRPYAPRDLVVAVVRRLEQGRRAEYPGEPLPMDYRLTPAERRGLMENARLVITKTLAAGGHPQALAIAGLPRWHFLKQIPEAWVALRRALRAKGVTPRW